MKLSLNIETRAGYKDLEALNITLITPRNSLIPVLNLCTKARQSGGLPVINSMILSMVENYLRQLYERVEETEFKNPIGKHNVHIILEPDEKVNVIPIRLNGNNGGGI